MIFKKLKPKIIHWFWSTNHPTFHSEERLVNSERGRECLVGLSILLFLTGVESNSSGFFCVRQFMQFLFLSQKLR